MFFSACLVSLVITYTLAGPMSTNNEHFVERAVAKADHISPCEAAPSCEMYTDDRGRERVRSKSGMEPGTSDYNHRMARCDLYSHSFQKCIDGPMVKMTAADTKKLDDVEKADAGRPTYLTIGDTAKYWGFSVDPLQAVGDLSAPCASTGACDSSSPWTLPVTYVTPSDFEETDQTLSITERVTIPRRLRPIPPGRHDRCLWA